jgi:PAS domain S-box-containing protein
MLSTPDQDATYPTTASNETGAQALVMTLCQAITAQSPIPLVMTHGPDHTIACASPAFAAIVGCPPSAIEGQTLAATLAGGGIASLLTRCAEVYASGHPTTLRDQAHAQPLGNAVAWTATIWPILDENAATLGLLIQVDDTTAQEHAIRLAHETRTMNEHLLIAGIREQELAEELQLQLAFISTITRSLGEGVYAFDRAGQVTYVNPTAQDMLGAGEAALVGSAANALVQEQPSGNRAGVPQPDPFLAVLETGATYRNDQAYARHRDGRLFPIAYTIAPIRGDAAVLGAVVVFRDLSAIRHLEATREEYLALLSHDLRSPLTVILGYGQQLLRKLGEPGQEKEAAKVRVIVESSLRMERMLKQVLEQSALESGPAALTCASLDLVALVRRMVDQLPAPDRERIALDGAEPVRMVGDSGRLERVVVNLLSNALKYSSAASPIVVRVFSSEDEAIMTIADRGVGINPEEIPHLFEKQYRARTAGTVEGLGLGLYSSQLIAVAHGGRIGVESAVGRGSTFTIRLPRHAGGGATTAGGIAR